MCEAIEVYNIHHFHVNNYHPPIFARECYITNRFDPIFSTSVPSTVHWFRRRELNNQSSISQRLSHSSSINHPPAQTTVCLSRSTSLLDVDHWASHLPVDHIIRSFLIFTSSSKIITNKCKTHSTLCNTQTDYCTHFIKNIWRIWDVSLLG